MGRLGAGDPFKYYFQALIWGVVDGTHLIITYYTQSLPLYSQQAREELGTQQREGDSWTWKGMYYYYLESSAIILSIRTRAPFR